MAWPISMWENGKPEERHGVIIISYAYLWLGHVAPTWHSGPVWNARKKYLAR